MTKINYAGVVEDTIVTHSCGFSKVALEDIEVLYIQVEKKFEKIMVSRNVSAKSNETR